MSTRRAPSPPATHGPRWYRMGADLATGDDFHLTDDDLAVHMAVLGGSGWGKSKFLERLGRCYTAGGRGFCLIDPHGDLSEDLLAYAAYQQRIRGDDSLVRRIHYLEPSYEMVFGYDPFQYRPLREIPAQHRQAAYDAWLHAKVDSVAEILQRKQGQMGFEGMPRLQRVLRDVLFAVGRAVRTDSGPARHLPLADALVLLDVEHPRHFDVFRLVAPFLDRDILSDFGTLHGFKRVEDLRRETESTVNRLRSLLGPVVKGIFSETVNTIDFYSIVQRGEILLVNLRETDTFSADQKSAIGGLFIHEVLTTAANTPRDHRKEFSLIIDEAGEFIGEDLMRALGAVRKYKLSLVLAGQDLSTFRKGDTDLAPKVLSQCGTVVTFQQAYQDDLAVLADRIGRGDLSFDKLYHEVDRPDGYDVLSMVEYSRAFTWGDNWSEGGSINSSSTVTRTRSWQESHQHNWSHGRSHQQATGRVDAHGSSETEVESRPMDSKRLGAGRLTKSAGAGRHVSAANSLTTSDAEQETVGGGHASSDGGSDADGHSTGRSVQKSQGGNSSHSLSESRKHMLVPRTRVEWQDTGRLVDAIADQLERIKTEIFRLGVGQARVKVRSRTGSMTVQVSEVRELWAESNKFRMIDRLKTELYAARPYFIPLPTGNSAQDARLDTYVRGEIDPDADAFVDTPLDVEATSELNPFGE